MTELGIGVADALRSLGHVVEPVADVPDEEDHWLIASVAGTSVVVVAAYATSETIVCHSILTERVPPARRAEVAEFIIRANHGLLEGNFELDLADGEVRFKTSAHITQWGELLDALDHAVRFNRAAVGVYETALRSVVRDETRAEDAIATVEGPRSDR